MPFCMFPDENEPIKVPLCELESKAGPFNVGGKKNCIP
jgi:hypothetical protein